MTARCSSGLWNLLTACVEVLKSCILSLGFATILFERRQLASSIGVVLVLYTFFNPVT